MTDETLKIADVLDETVHPWLAKIKVRYDALPSEEKKRLEDESLKHKSQQRWAEVRSLRSAMKAPERHFQCAVVSNNEWGRKLEVLKEKIGSGFMVALVGNRGNGKTQMGVRLMFDATEKLKSSLFCTAMGFFMEIKATYRKDSRATEASVVRDFCRPELLVIDEIGKRSDSEWENSLIFELLNNRYNEMKDTILIDNRTKADFEKVIGPSLAGRISESGGIVECDWESFR